MALTKKQLDSIQFAVSLLNGPAEYQEDREVFGYIETREKMVVPRGFDLAFDYCAKSVVDLSAPSVPTPNLIAPSIIDNSGNFIDIDVGTSFNYTDYLLVIAALNWEAFAAREAQAVGAFMRATLAVRGYLLRMGADTWGELGRHVYEDEVVFLPLDEVNNIWQRNRSSVLAALDTEPVKFVMRNHVALLSILDVVFVSRGHHFVGEEAIGLIALPNEQKSGRYSYSELYSAVFKACFPGEKEHIIDRKAFYRTALHPFGVYLGRRLHKAYADKNKLPAALIVRARPAPAGSAKITTSYAIYKMLLGSPFLTQAHAQMTKLVGPLPKIAERILADPAKYHQNRGLLGGALLNDQEKLDYSSALASANALAPLLVGYITVECADAPISKQKTLTRPADDQIGLKNRVIKMFHRLDETVGAESPATVISALIPRTVVERTEEIERVG